MVDGVITFYSLSGGFTQSDVGIFLLPIRVTNEQELGQVSCSRVPTGRMQLQGFERTTVGLGVKHPNDSSILHQQTMRRRQQPCAGTVETTTRRHGSPLGRSERGSEGEAYRSGPWPGRGGS